MSNATLEMMQEIEQSCSGVIVGWRSSRTIILNRICAIALATAAMSIGDERNQAIGHRGRKRLRASSVNEIWATVAHDAKVQQAMTDKRAG